MCNDNPPPPIDMWLWFGKVSWTCCNQGTRWQLPLDGSRGRRWLLWFILFSYCCCYLASFVLFLFFILLYLSFGLALLALSCYCCKYISLQLNKLYRENNYSQWCESWLMVMHYNSDHAAGATKVRKWCILQWCVLLRDGSMGAFEPQTALLWHTWWRSAWECVTRKGIVHFSRQVFHAIDTFTLTHLAEASHPKA